MIDAIKSWIPLVVAIVAFALGNVYGQARVHEQWTKADNAELTAYKTKALEVIKEKDLTLISLIFLSLALTSCASSTHTKIENAPSSNVLMTETEWQTWQKDWTTIHTDFLRELDQ